MSIASSIIEVVKYGLKIYSDKVDKEWPRRFEKYERIIMEQERRSPVDREMDLYDQAKREIYILHEQISLLMKQQAKK